MKIKTVILSVLMLFSLSTLSAQNKKENKLETIVFDVPMTCEACKKAIEGQLSFEKGVKDLEVFLKDNKVSVTYDKTKTDFKKLQASFAKIGRTATVPEADQTLAVVSKDETAKKSTCCKSDNKDAKAGDSAKCSDAKKKENCPKDKKTTCSAKEQTTAGASKTTATKPRKRPESCCR